MSSRMATEYARRAWGSKAAGPGRQRYTKITELYPDVHPPYVHGQPATFSETLYP
jgi:hypothetical protein